MRKLTKQNLEDIIVGCSFLGTGGGGSFPAGMKRIYDDLAAGLTFNLLSPDEMKDDDYAAATYGVGSTAPVTPEEQKKYASLPRVKEEPTAISFRLLQNYLGKKFVATIAGEIGPGNTALALSAAAHMDLPQLDADTVGRAAPEIDQNTILAAGIQIVPAAGATQFGDEMLLTKIARTSREEDFFRAASTVSMGIGVTDSAIPGKAAKRPGVVVQGSISHAEEVGKAYRKAIENHQEPIQAVLNAGKGYKLFDGKITDFHWKDKGGYLVGEVEIAGTGVSQGSKYRIAYMNENLISWRDEKVSVTCPDLITMVVTETGKAIANPQFEKGQNTTVIGFPAPAPWRTPAGLNLFGPAHFGYDTPYVPIEDRFRAGG
ncbi:MAG: DUF917 domain-containing protein [Candidatus Acidiferrales bacterium]